jgi:hypothetical protein
MPFDNPYHSPIGTVEILLDVRDRIASQDKWVQGRFSHGDRHCLVAALSLACGSRSFSIPNKAERQFARVLARQLPPETNWWLRLRLVSARQRLMSFNDDAERCHGDVIALVDRTIEHQLKVPQYA